MSLSPQQIDAISGLLAVIPAGGNPLPALRSEVKEIPIARCDADDMRGEIPFRRLPAFDIFLVNAASHCWRLVAEPEDASGVIIAARSG